MHATTVAVDLAFDNMEEAASAEAERVFPFKNGPLSVFKDVLDDAHHGGRSKAGSEHLSNRALALNGHLGHLVIHRMLGVERRQTIRIGAIERFNPELNKFAWSHGRPNV